tara:strand:- start:34410 stop:34862 length:453 start_codon:yes stop_codon:yes gene_type:complete
MVDIALIGVMLFLATYWRKVVMRVTPSLPSEHDEQAGFVQWFRAKWPRVLIFAIPNGGKRSIVTAKRLRREGVTPGVPDLYIPAWGIWIEMKRQKGGRTSPDQNAMIQYLEEIGHTVIVGYGAMDASDKLLRVFNLGGAADEGGHPPPRT